MLQAHSLLVFCITLPPFALRGRLDPRFTGDFFCVLQ